MIEQTRRWYSRTLVRATVMLLVASAGFACYRAAPGTRPGAPANAIARAGLAGNPQDDVNFQQYFVSLAFADDGYATDIVSKYGFVCRNPADCGGNPIVNIRIVPARLSYDVDWRSALGSGRGHLVAKIVILDKDVPIGPLGLGPNETGYLWIGQNRGGNSGKPAIYPITSNGVVGKPTKLKANGYCNDGINQWPAVHINLRCRSGLKPFPEAGNVGESAAASLQLALMPYRKPDTRLAGGSAEDPAMQGEDLWVSCRHGCCRVLMEAAEDQA